MKKPHNTPLENRCIQHIRNQSLCALSVLAVGSLTGTAPKALQIAAVAPILSSVALATADQWKNRNLDREIERLNILDELAIAKEAVQFAALEQKILEPATTESVDLEILEQYAHIYDDPVYAVSTTTTEYSHANPKQYYPTDSYNTPDLSLPKKKPTEINELLARFHNETDKYAWMQELINPSVLLVYGGDGSGKTTFAKKLIKQRKEAGHHILVIDPHNTPGKWGDCVVKGGGLNYDEVETTLEEITSLLKDRYEQMSTGEIKEGEFDIVTIVAEEVTNWSADVSNAHLLLTKAGEYRKGGVRLLLISHGNNLKDYGAPAGKFNTTKRLMTELELLSKPGVGGAPVPALKGYLKLPNTDETKTVFLPALEAELTESSTTTTTAKVSQKVVSYGRSLNTESYTPPVAVKDGFPPLSLLCDQDKNVKLLISMLSESKEVSDNSFSEKAKLDLPQVRSLFRTLIANYPATFDFFTDSTSLHLTTETDFSNWS